MKQLNNKMVIPNVVKYWIWPSKEGYILKLVCEDESTFELIMKTKGEFDERMYDKYKFN